VILPRHDYQTTKMAPPEPLHRNLDRAVNQLLGKLKRRPARIKYWQQQAEKIIRQSLLLRELGNEELTDRLLQVKAVCRRKGSEIREETIIESFSLIAEASERSLGIRPYVVQILAALALQQGYLTEMATGEGKTLTAAFPAILTAWSAQPCHIVTANDYLAQRDAEELSPLYTFCSVTTGWIEGKMDSNERRHNYRQGVVYTTGKELLADFLRDRLSAQGQWDAPRWQLQRQLGTVQPSSNGPVLRGINTAIIDEADSVLIDEAVTPLIISQPQPNQALNEACLQARKVADNLNSGADYQIDQHYREITLTPEGRANITALSVDFRGWFATEERREELLLTALSAKEFYQPGRQYLLDDDKVVIIDEYTGRMMPDRSWRQGLHQAIEARENLPLTEPNETLAQLSFQNFFRLFKKLSGLTGTAQETAAEFWDIYHLPVVPIPTNKPGQRKILPAWVFPDQKSKWQALCTEVAKCHQHGQPVLIGTRSVASSEKLAGMLTELQIPFQLLNALKHREEAEIITAAGTKGQVTIATNMAGRGADIKLGSGVLELGGLHVILSEQHESKRIDRQLQGRCARQGDPGSVRTYTSLDDAVLRQNLPRPILKIVDRRVTRPMEIKLATAACFAHAQKVAQRKTFQQRKAVLESDKWLSQALSFAAPNVALQ